MVRRVLINMLEKEVKILLSIQEYERLFSIFDFEEPFIQTNYYYEDSKSAINNVTIRIREKNDKYKLQVKIPKNIEGSIHIKEEYEEDIDKVYETIDKEILKQATEIDFEDDLLLIGKLVTKRLVCNKYDDVVIALDANKYLDVKDYELEIEYCNEYPQYIMDILKEHDIKINDLVLGKNNRFNKRLRTIQKHG